MNALFEPLAIGPLTLKNRVVMAPMTTLFDLDAGDRCEAFYAARARGGAAMVTLNLQSLPSDRPSGLLALDHEGHLPRLARLVARLHECGSLACAQLAASSTWAPGGPGDRTLLLSPSGVRPEGRGFRPDAGRLPFFPAAADITSGGMFASADVLARIPAAMASAAVRAVRAGFDAVQVTASSASLLGQFLSPFFNRRDDGYGGVLAHRALLLLDTVRAVRTAAGPGVAVMCRINGDDLHPNGMSAGDYAELVPLLVAAGVDAIDVMPGGFLSRVPVNQACVPQGAFTYVSEALRLVSKVPVSAGTRIGDPALAQRIVAEGRADFVSLGTALIADPDWAANVEAGRADEVRPCTACCGCWNDLTERHQAIRCSVNPEAGQEAAGDPRPPATAPLRVVIVGAGPAGMTAATSAAADGHHVTLFDRHVEPAGQLALVSRLLHKDDLRALVACLKRALVRHHVTLVSGVEATGDRIMNADPDVVVLATGGVAQPSGYATSSWCPLTCLEALPLVSISGRRAVVIGGDRDACETAEWLATRGTDTTLITPGPAAADNVETWNRWVLIDRLEACGVHLVLGAAVISASADGIELSRGGAASRFIPADLVVHATDWAPDHTLAAALVGRVPVVFATGRPGTEQGVGEAVRAGHAAARAIAGLLS